MNRGPLGSRMLGVGGCVGRAGSVLAVGVLEGADFFWNSVFPFDC